MEFSKRKSMRLKEHDYSETGIYHITFCTLNRELTLSTVVGRDDLGTPSAESVLSAIGKVVDKYINTIEMNYSDVKIDKYIIMPNHVHMLVRITNQTNGAPGSSRPTQMIPRIVAVIKKLTNKDAGYNIWQDSYYDHIIRDENDYKVRWKYIDDNPIKWNEGEYYRR